MNHIKPNLIKKNQNLSKPEDSLKVWGGPTTTPPSIHLGTFVVTLSTLSRFAVAAGFGRRAEDEHVASRAEPALEQDRRQRRTGASSGRRPGRWGRSTGAPRQLEDRLPRLSEVAILRHFLDVWNLNHLISISILVGFFWSNVWSLIFC